MKDYLRGNSAIFAIGALMLVALVVLAYRIEGIEQRLLTVRLEAGTLASNLESTLGSKIGDTQIMASDLAARVDAIPPCVGIASLPIQITQPGHYCLTQSIDVSSVTSDAIDIASSDVSIDGRGFTIIGPTDPTTTSRGILAVDQSRLTVENISIGGFQTAVLIGDTDVPILGTKTYPSDRKSRDILITGVRIDNATFQGIHVRADNFTITNNTIAGIGPSSVIPDAFATGIFTRGNGCEISGNRVMLGDAIGTGENVGIGAHFADGCRIERNIIVFDKFPEYGRNFGIWTKPEGGALPYVRNNYVSGAHYAYGPHGLFKNNVAADTLCSLFTVRPSPEDGFFDLGGNVSRETSGQVRPGTTTCYSDPDRASARFEHQHSAESAYGVALALTESDPIAKDMEIRAWLLVAACLGHSQAANDTKLLPEDPMTAEAKTVATTIRAQASLECVDSGS